MRELKFRAWYENKMYDNIQDWDDYHSILRDMWSLQSILEDKRWNVMQYTGLYDCKNVEIYDNDILQHGLFAINDNEKFGSEPWCCLPDGIKDDDITTIYSRFEFKWTIDGLSKLQYMCLENPDVSGVEIIGNIYQNSKLLKSNE